MGVAFRISPKEARRITVPETGKAAELADRTRIANNLAYEVKSNWERLPPSLRDALVDLAYSDPSEPLPQSLGERLRSIRNRWRLVRVIREEPEVMRDFLNAMNNLAETVLDAVERENPDYQEALTKAIEEALSDTKWPAMNAEQARERNQELFDQALE